MGSIRRFLQTFFEKPSKSTTLHKKTSEDHRRDLEEEKLRPVNRSGG